MGNVSYASISESINNSNRYSVGFFNLKNDGDEAIVRFMHDNTESFNIVAVHPVKVAGKSRKVNCIRDAKDPLDKCPFCNGGIKLENRIYIRLIQYVKDESGNIVPEAKVWERSLVYASKLANLINEYGPLSDVLFKIKRHGVARSMDTSYDIMYASPQVYRPELYPKREDLFNDYTTMGTVIMDKSYDDMLEFLSTGNFPERRVPSNNQVEAVPTYQAPPQGQQGQPAWTGGYTQPTSTPYPNPQFTPVQQTSTAAPSYQNSVPNVSANPGFNERAPWEASSPAPINRPTRTY